MNNVSTFTLINKTKSKLPRLPFLSIKNKILGEKYELELCFLSSKEQKKLNYKYRGKNETTNILSFPLSKMSGEIIIDPVKAKTQISSFRMKYPEFIKYLFIHGCLHLKGFNHGSIMNKHEEKYLEFFS